MPGEPQDGAADATPFDDDTPWKAWTPESARARLCEIRTQQGRSVRWAVAGGWALDLFLGRVTRPHDDLEIVVLDDDVPSVLGAFSDPQWLWKVPIEGWLHPLTSPAYQETHQTWLWSDADNAFVLDVFRDSHDGDTWICRRDPSLTMPWTAVVESTSGGVPYLIPEVVLLFKAKHARRKDLRDLHTTLPALDATRRDWLRSSLQSVHPGHDWLRLL